MSQYNYEKFILIYTYMNSHVGKKRQKVIFYHFYQIWPYMYSVYSSWKVFNGVNLCDMYSEKKIL